jgi:hypothetical protein
MWYFLQSILNKPNTFIEINGSHGSMTKYFLSNVDNEKFIDNVKFSAVAQSGFTKKTLLDMDYLHDIRMGNIPVFSERFVDSMNEYLHQMVDFYPCRVLLNGDDYQFYISRIKQVLSVIDKDASGYRTLTDGSKIIDEPIIIKQTIEQSLLIVRDADYKSIVIVSELFKDIATKKKLKMKFYDTSQTFW